MTSRHKSDQKSAHRSKPLGKNEFRAGIIRYSKKDANVAPLKLDFGFTEVRSRGIWLSLIIEFVGTLLQTFISCGIVIASLNYGYNPPTVPIAILHVFLLPFFIYATAAASGGHLNPTISIATVATRLMTPTRGLFYIMAQVSGAILGALFLSLCIGEEVTAKYQLGRCLIGNNMNPWGAYGFEVISTFFLLFIAFGTAFDPRQREVYGPILPPFMISGTLGIVIFVGGGLVAGYSGPIMNPARCLGPSVVLHNFEGQLIYWFGPLTASAFIGVVYWLVPPQHVAIKEEKKHHKNKAHQSHDEHMDDLKVHVDMEPIQDPSV